MVYLAELLVVMTSRLKIVRNHGRTVPRVHGHKRLDDDASLAPVCDVHAPGTRRCRACSMRQGRRPVKTKKKSRPWTIGACLSLSGSSIYLPRFIKIGGNLMNFCQEQNAQFF